MRSSRFLVALVGAVAGCGGESAKPLPAEAADALGPYAVGHVTFTAVDGARDDRSLPVDVWYPVDPEDAEGLDAAEYALLGALGIRSDAAVADAPVSTAAEHPLLVFSHGYGGIRVQSFGLMEALASHGFVAASAEHAGNSQASPDDDFDTAAANRVPDVSFVIDTLLARSRDATDPFFGRIDASAVGALGHSFGGMTAVGMAAGWAGAPPDPRVRSILPISAVIDGDLQRDDRPSPNAGFTPARLEEVTVPVLLMGGTEDTNVPIENNAIAFERMTNAPRVVKVDVLGANHNHFAAICPIADFLFDLGFGPDAWPGLGAGDLVAPYEQTCTADVLDIEEAQRLQNLFAVAFFRATLRDEGAYDAYLTPSYAAGEPHATVTAR